MLEQVNFKQQNNCQYSQIIKYLNNNKKKLPEHWPREFMICTLPKNCKL